MKIRTGMQVPYRDFKRNKISDNYWKGVIDMAEFWGTLMEDYTSISSATLFKKLNEEFSPNINMIIHTLCVLETFWIRGDDMTKRAKAIIHDNYIQIEIDRTLDILYSESKLDELNNNIEELIK